MSFRDLESGPKGSHQSKQQPKQRRDEDSSFERSIRANIQEMQETVRKAGEHLEHAQRSFLSKRLGESLDGFLERSRDLSQETEQLFREWTVHLAGEPSERHRKKFSFEKLQKAFEEEVLHLKDVARRRVQVQEALAADRGRPRGVECHSMCEDQGALGADDVEQGLLDDSGAREPCRLSQEEVTIRSRIAQEREEGIRRIQSQVSEVNQIFRDLACIVNEQGQQFESIEQQAEMASASTRQAAQELKKAVDRQRGTREHLCCMLAAAMILLCFVILPHMHMLGFSHVASSGLPSVSSGEANSPGPILTSEVIISKVGRPLT